MQLKFTVSQRTARHPTEGEGRGEQSTLAFKGKCTEMACREKSCFWQGKRVLFYTTIETF